MDPISIDDFQKLDIRVGTVVDASVPEWSHWVTKLEVDFGKELGKRVIFAGIMKFYKSEDLVGKQFPFVVNMKPKKMGPEGDTSNGMMLAASMKLEKDEKSEEEEKPILFKLSQKVPNGTKVR
ncbi:MAG TPA: methionine--tRNA ligase [Patescibacteria group bacterium]